MSQSQYPYYQQLPQFQASFAHGPIAGPSSAPNPPFYNYWQHPIPYQHPYAGSTADSPVPEHVTARPALIDSTTSTLNVFEPANPTRGTKRKCGTNQSTSKRQKHASNSTLRPNSTIPVPVVPGVGPSAVLTASESSSVSHPALIDHTSILEKPKPSTAVASDVWYCTRRLKSADRLVVPFLEKETLYTTRPDPEDWAWLGCRFCNEANKWRTWRNTQGLTACIRAHLEKDHGELYRAVVISQKLKGWETLGQQKKPTPSFRKSGVEFSLEGFYERLTRWIVSDDQSVNVVDSPELRELLLFIGIDAELEDSDIPHRTKLLEMIVKRFEVEYQTLISDIYNSLGRISFTSDLWSQNNLESYMVVTAHYLVMESGWLEMRLRLVAFRLVQGSHTGVNLAQTFVRILQELGIVHRVGMITLDNASNNHSMMEEIALLLNGMGVPFDCEGNRIRCFPHVVNIAVKTGLKFLTNVQLTPRDLELEPNFNNTAQPGDNVPLCLIGSDFFYCEALKSDIIKRSRSLVTACRASGQRREDFIRFITDGNEKKDWGAEVAGSAIRPVTLLRDVETRWSYTFLMIDRLIELYPAVRRFLAAPKQHEISIHLLNNKELEVLSDIRQFLSVPHAVQELVSGEKTPTLSIVLPIYEELIQLLNDLKARLPRIAHAIAASVEKLEEYLANLKARRTRIYALAMIINPTMKFKWLEKHEEEDKDEADRIKKLLKNAMLEYRKAARAARPATSTKKLSARASSASSGARALTSGRARLNELKRSLSSSNEQFVMDMPAPEDGVAADLTERLALAEDEKFVDKEIRRYIDAGVIDPKDTEDFDLLVFWQASRREYPTIYSVALDILPAQASAVPCEHVFSSGKETDTDRRSSLSPVMMEILQMLKYSFRAQRLDFNDEWIGREEDISMIEIEPSTIHDILSTPGRLPELMDLISTANAC